MGLGRVPNGPGRDPQWAWGEIPAVKPGCALGEAAWVGGSGVQCVLLGSEDRVMGGGGREADCRSWKESSFPGVPTVFKWTGSPGPWRHPGLGIRLGTEEEGLGQKQEDMVSRCPSNISVLHVPALQAACQNVAGQGWPP